MLITRSKKEAEYFLNQIGDDHYQIYKHPRKRLYIVTDAPEGVAQYYLNGGQ